jgi:hypothetical protein
MRKKIVGLPTAGQDVSNQDWLDLEEIATVEVTSEDPRFPVESAFSSNGGSGWRAAEAGEQQIRIIFDEPVSLRRIQLRFEEPDAERMQEFAIRWSPDPNGQPREIVRQQWNFSPSGSTVEAEDYTVELPGLSVLELTIRPDLSGRKAVATLSSCRLSSRPPGNRV